MVSVSNKAAMCNKTGMNIRVDANDGKKRDIIFTDIQNDIFNFQNELFLCSR